MDKLFAILAAVTTLLASSASAGEQYECRQFLFLGCKTIYVGTATESDVTAYVDDARVTLAWLNENIPGVKQIDYEPKRGIVVVERKQGEMIGAKNLWRIYRTMAASKLNMSHVIELSHGRNFAVGHYASKYDVGGHSRFLVLQDVTATMPERWNEQYQ